MAARTYAGKALRTILSGEGSFSTYAVIKKEMGGSDAHSSSPTGVLLYRNDKKRKGRALKPG